MTLSKALSDIYIIIIFNTQLHQYHNDKTVIIRGSKWFAYRFDFIKLRKMWYVYNFLSQYM